MIETPHLSEVFRIIEGALRLDGEKVRNYGRLLADKLEQDGDKGSAQRLRKLLSERTVQLHPTKMEQHSAPPVDGESRFPLVQRVRIPDHIDRFLFTASQKQFVDEYLSIVGSRAVLENKGIKAGTNLLLYGPPGCGKSFLACYIAHKLGLPLYVARLDGLISSFLGSTSKNIRAVFEFASKTPCVLLLDEFDAVAKLRDDQQELGELKRVVNSFIQSVDALTTDVILIAATNHEQLLDPAVWRRFHYLLHIGPPTLEQREQLWELYSGELHWSPKELKVLSDLSDGYSAAAIEAAATRLRQRRVTHKERPSLRTALLSLLALARGETLAKNELGSHLHNPVGLTHVLRKRNPQIYSLSLIGEIAGVSKATMSRLDTRNGKKKAGSKHARRTPVHKNSST